MRFTNLEDPLNRWKLDTVALIVTKVQKYCVKHNLRNVILREVEDNRWSDPDNGRFDIEIIYENENGKLFEQKLLYLQGEIIDGKEFHERIEEFYPRRRA